MAADAVTVVSAAEQHTGRVSLVLLEFTKQTSVSRAHCWCSALHDRC